MPRITKTADRPRMPKRASVISNYSRAVTSLLQYIRWAQGSHLQGRIDSRWEIATYIALYRITTNGLNEAQTNICRMIHSEFPALMVDFSDKNIDPSLYVTGLYVDWLSRRPSRIPPNGCTRMVKVIRSSWVNLRDKDTSDSNSALLACNALASTYMLQSMLGDTQMPVLGEHLDVFNRFAEYWRRWYDEPTRPGESVDTQTQDAIYFATHTVMAFSLWGSLCNVGKRERFIRPEREFIRRLVARKQLVAEIGVDPASEVYICVLPLGLPTQPGWIGRLKKQWDTEKSRLSRQEDNFHYLQHVAINILYALRTC